MLFIFGCMSSWMLTILYFWPKKNIVLQKQQYDFNEAKWLPFKRRPVKKVYMNIYHSISPPPKKNNKTTTLSKTKHNSPKMSSNSLLFISMVTSLITMVTFIITMVSYTHVKWAIHRIQNMKENIFFCTKHLFYFDVIFLTYCGIIFFPPLQ